MATMRALAAMTTCWMAAASSLACTKSDLGAPAPGDAARAHSTGSSVPPSLLDSGATERGAASQQTDASPPASAGDAGVTPMVPIQPATTERRHPDYAVTLAGKLTVRAPDTTSRSHGIGNEPWVARFLMRNLTASPLSVSIDHLELISYAEHTDAGAASQSLRIDHVEIVRATQPNPPRPGPPQGDAVPTGPKRVVIPASEEKEILLFVDSRQELTVHYHVLYRHEAVFRIGTETLRARSYTMHFRYPHRAWPE